MTDTTMPKDQKVQSTAADTVTTFSVDDGKIAGLADADEALAVFAGQELVEVDEATNKRILRKIDRIVLPMLCIVYGLSVPS